MWQPDADVHSCVCGTRFSMFVRKHHCRLCGHVFCSECTGSRGNIPSFIQTRLEATSVRLCDACSELCTETIDSEPIVRVLALLPVSVRTIRNLAINKRWHHAVKTLLNVYRKLPSKMPYERFSRLETELLKSHMYRTGGHSHWDIQTVRALKCTPNPHRTHTCKQLGCPPSCSPTSELHVVELLNSFPSTQILRVPELCAWSNMFLQRMSYVDHVRHMPHWLRRSMTPSAQKFLVECILPLCSNIHIAYAFYYECKLYADPVYKDLSKKMLHMHPVHTRHFVATDSLVQYVNHIVDGERFSVKLPARLPYNPSTLVRTVHDPVQLQTATRPSVITMKTDKGVKYILVKKDDLTKDRLVMHFAHLIETLCETKCVQYPVFVTPTGGWIEMLPKAKTLYELKYELSSHIYNEFPEVVVRCVRRRFIRSAIGACVLSYLLGVGDRHLQNMVISGGELAHIDFSYILGYDPKLHMDIRITTPMIQMMGGTHSKDYLSFVHGVTAAFHKIRQYTGLWYALMTYLSTNYSLVEIQEHVTRKLMPGALQADATMRIVDIVKNNSNTWRHNISDITHQKFQMDF